MRLPDGARLHVMRSDDIVVGDMIEQDGDTWFVEGSSAIGEGQVGVTLQPTLGLERQA